MKENTKDELKNIIKDLHIDNQKFQFDAVRRARACKGEINSYLLEELKSIVESLNKDNMDVPIFAYYASYLLAEFRETQACPLILKLISQPYGEAFDYLGDGIMEDMTSIIVSVFDGNMSALNQLIEDKALDAYTRCKVLRTYIYFYEHGIVDKEALIAYLRKLIPHYDDNDYHMYDGILSLIVDCHLFEMIDDVREMFEQDKIDYSFRGGYDDFIDDIFDYKLTDRLLERVDPIDDFEHRMASWAYFEHDESSENEDIKELPQTFQELVEKNVEMYDVDYKNVGRNDPCPCGSGKKFKKCCIDKASKMLPYQKYIEESLSSYPIRNNNPEEVDFYSYYKDEYIQIDKLLYKALKRKRVPLFIKRDKNKEMLWEFQYLEEAFPLIQEAIEQNQFKTIEEYDKTARIHYSLLSFFARYCTCLYAIIEMGRKEYLKKFEDVICYFYDKFEISEAYEGLFFDKIDDYCRLAGKYEEAIQFFERKLKTHQSCRYDLYQFLFHNYSMVYEYDDAIKKMEELIEQENDEELKDALEELKLDYLDDDDTDYEY